MTEIKLITENTDIESLNIKPLDWDVVSTACNKPYYVAHIKGYVHTIGGKWGDNDLWAWPRDEEPSYENLVEFSSDDVVRWGLIFKQNMYLTSKYDETEIRCSSGTVITRNDEKFYFVRGSMDYSLAKARMLITKVQEGPLDVNSIDFDKKLKGRVIMYRGFAAIIERYINGQGCIIIRYAGPEMYKKIVYDVWECDEEDEDEPRQKLDIIGYDHHDIKWYF